jgi:hypothetical protein
MIVDILNRDDSRQIRGARFGQFAKRITTRSEPAEPARRVDQPDIQIAGPYYLVSGSSAAYEGEENQCGCAQQDFSRDNHIVGESLS